MKNYVDSVVVKKIIQTGTRHDEFRKILLELDLRVRGEFFCNVNIKKLTIAIISPGNF